MTDTPEPESVETRNDRIRDLAKSLDLEQVAALASLSQGAWELADESIERIDPKAVEILNQLTTMGLVARLKSLKGSSLCHTRYTRWTLTFLGSAVLKWRDR